MRGESVCVCVCEREREREERRGETGLEHKPAAPFSPAGCLQLGLVKKRSVGQPACLVIRSQETQCHATAAK